MCQVFSAGIVVVRGNYHPVEESAGIVSVFRGFHFDLPPSLGNERPTGEAKSLTGESEGCRRGGGVTIVASLRLEGGGVICGDCHCHHSNGGSSGCREFSYVGGVRQRWHSRSGIAVAPSGAILDNSTKSRR